MNRGASPRLVAVTRPLPAAPDFEALLQYADPTTPMVWFRDDRGCVALGEVVRLRARGEDRFARLSAAWKRIAACTTVTDPLQLPGTGLLAFGTFAFDQVSAAESVLVVPRFVIARHRDRGWITEIRHEHEPARLDAGTDPLHEMFTPRPFGGFSGVTLPVTEPNPSYLAGVRATVQHITEGHAEKVVLARQITSQLAADADLRVPLLRLAQRYTDCWTFAVDGMLGASPETLMRHTDGAITARVLAGTRPRADTPEADEHARAELITSAKEQHEHAFAVQSVITALSPYVSELRTSEEPFALKLPNVWHLATDVGAQPPATASALDLAAALQPTAAVAGTPTQAALETIRAVEPFDRGRYAGAVGWIDAHGDGEWVLALRSAQLGGVTPGARTRTITATAGGGIVVGSEPDREFAETVSKFRPIVEAFAPNDTSA